MIRLDELNMQREKTRLITLELCRDAKATLNLLVQICDARDVLTSFLRQLRKTQVELRFLNEEIEQLVDMGHLDQEFATNIKYEAEIMHNMVRLYYQLKDKKPETIEQCEISDKFYSSKKLNEFLALTQLCNGTTDFNTVGEPSLLPGMPPCQFSFIRKNLRTGPIRWIPLKYKREVPFICVNLKSAAI